MRVCHLGKYYPPAPGGIETHVQTLARAQRALGLEVQVLCMNHEHTDMAPEIDFGVRVRRFRKTASLFEMHFCRDLVKAIRAVRADILHLHVPNPVMLLHLWLARPRIPLVVTYHSDVVRQRVRAALFRPVERRVYRRVEKIILTSELYAAGSRFLKPYAQRQIVVPMGLDLEPYLHPSAEHLRAARELRANYTPLWFYCGRLVYYKGLDVALRALRDTPGTLVVVGSGPELDALAALARELGVTDRVVFKGNISYLETVPYFLAATAFWFPSNARSEAFGLVQVEAMACGCPVINTAIPHSGVTWVSPHDESGLSHSDGRPGRAGGGFTEAAGGTGPARAPERGCGGSGANGFRSSRDAAERCVRIYTSVLADAG